MELVCGNCRGEPRVVDMNPGEDSVSTEKPQDDLEISMVYEQSRPNSISSQFTESFPLMTPSAALMAPSAAGPSQTTATTSVSERALPAGAAPPKGDSTTSSSVSLKVDNSYHDNSGSTAGSEQRSSSSLSKQPSSSSSESLEPEKVPFYLESEAEPEEGSDDGEESDGEESDEETGG